MNWTKTTIALVIIVSLALIGYFVFGSVGSTSRQEKRSEVSNKSDNMKITSSAFGDGQVIPPKYSCDGEEVNPPLKIEEVPVQTETLVLVVDDPDAPGGTFTHWTVWNINPGVGDIEEDSVPRGAVEGTTSFEEVGYGGPCPPGEKHRYRFKVYALDKELSLKRGASKEELDRALEGHVIEKDELVGVYSR